MTSLRPYLLLVVVSLACLTGIGLLFWYQDLQYARPTPRPALLVQQPVGARLLLGTKGAVPGGKPLLLHFFNPSCPCSRFNRRHLRDLYNQYGQAVDMVVVLQAKDTLEAIRKYRDWELPMAYVTDPAGELAERCGVYATPQAVLLSVDARLYYRGNYNTGRYCVNRDTQFARRAVEALLAGRAAPLFPSTAGTAYGCLLPAYEDQEF
ncbi:MAG: redoxin domain-containing protein [Cytophagales bacterium]|nr:redoxin domain-containing protein [Cytophagales bacterium]